MTSVLVDKSDGVAMVHLNRPEALNALDTSTVAELDRTLAALAGDPGVRAIGLVGEGRAFCVGRDRKEPRPPETEALNAYLDGKAADAIPHRLYSLGVPVVAGLHGHTIGMGLEMALACDVRVAAPDVSISMPEVSFGLLPSRGGVSRLAEVIGTARATSLLLTGERIDAHTAESWGLVTEVTRESALQDRVREIAAAIARSSPAAVRVTREALSLGRLLGTSDALRLEAVLSATLLHSPEREAGLKKFERGKNRDQEGKSGDD